MAWKRVLALLPAVGIAACETNPLAPDTARTQLMSDGLATRLTVDRSRVEPGGEFTVTYTIRNTRPESFRLESSCVAIARGIVYRNDREVALIGSGSGCFPSIATHEIARGDSLERRWRVRAGTHGVDPDTRQNITLAKSGRYVFRVEPDVFQINGEAARLPTLDVRIEIR